MISYLVYKISYIEYILFTKEDITFSQVNKISYLTYQRSYLVYITETSPYSFGNFRKLSLYNCFMPIQLINSP